MDPQLQTIIKTMNKTRRINMMSLTSAGFFKHDIKIYKNYNKLEEIITKKSTNKYIKYSNR